MSTGARLAVMLRRIITHPTGGVPGLVDEMLAICSEHALELDWRAERCRFRSLDGEWEELTDVPLRQSVFRAILARVAVLCNEQIPNSVSPYGGQGQISAGGNSAVLFRVSFTNTTAEQKLEWVTETGPDTNAVRRPKQIEEPAGDTALNGTLPETATKVENR